MQLDTPFIGVKVEEFLDTIKTFERLTNLDRQVRKKKKKLGNGSKRGHSNLVNRTSKVLSAELWSKNHQKVVYRATGMNKLILMKNAKRYRVNRSIIKQRRNPSRNASRDSKQGKRGSASLPLKPLKTPEKPGNEDLEDQRSEKASNSITIVKSSISKSVNIEDNPVLKKPQLEYKNIIILTEERGKAREGKKRNSNHLAAPTISEKVMLEVINSNLSEQDNLNRFNSLNFKTGIYSFFQLPTMKGSNLTPSVPRHKRRMTSVVPNQGSGSSSPALRKLADQASKMGSFEKTSNDWSKRVKSRDNNDENLDLYNGGRRKSSSDTALSLEIALNERKFKNFADLSKKAQLGLRRELENYGVDLSYGQEKIHSTQQDYSDVGKKTQHFLRSIFRKHGAKSPKAFQLSKGNKPVTLNFRQNHSDNAFQIYDLIRRVDDTRKRYQDINQDFVKSFDHRKNLRQRLKERNVAKAEQALELKFSNENDEKGKGGVSMFRVIERKMRRRQRRERGASFEGTRSPSSVKSGSRFDFQSGSFKARVRKQRMKSYH